ncbi:cilia- and flagella-associated protein 20 [Halyomorpha halys]|uniref:cilia- and flagella-associated protein 20 n=1 Tax=Halyomorpha halys TaxID=286706 RepID=UPI0006D4C842|nr:cilia- and flagella-associated protein 20-like [Halyomorpha halys]
MSTKNLTKKTKKTEEKEVIKIETLLCSTDEYPLLNWSKFIKAGYIKRIEDEEIRDKVLEVLGPTNSVWITTPREMGEKIGTTFDWLFFIIKPFPYKELTIELQVMDNANKRHGFKFENKITTTNNRHIFSKIGIDISHGWSLLELDLQKLVSKCCGTRFTELCCIRIHGSCRLLRVFTAASYVSQDDLPIDYRPYAKTAFTGAKKFIPVANT